MAQGKASSALRSELITSLKEIEGLIDKDESYDACILYLKTIIEHVVEAIGQSDVSKNDPAGGLKQDTLTVLHTILENIETENPSSASASLFFIYLSAKAYTSIVNFVRGL
ncbi:hypothetical protein QNI19_11015 [Cytophagaceae bacterium DM2B3-1]|uniref:Uncharacterized protein n=1 Tax=Xanthocytophaga flava TaxID=3048013 RepID=A0AAE3U605_9BACT|nr:hypothetical protein [Xanthocytophaga flavus]MDJ1469517.1 hypothetical protein [Xanthocytophaga flavus]MDJ1480841.1 hypothetical protein [Xanthocytophaga flavus]MDJ1493463.1 hypothetical protein [Xanthocytophaga flavus]